MTASLHLSPEVVGTLAEGRQCYVAVPSRHGPHVTPELFTWAGDRLWFASASTTLKSKVLTDGVPVGILVSAGGRDVVMTGVVTRFDIRHPMGLARHLTQLPDASIAWASYVVRNAPDLLAFVSDTALGRLGSRIPPVRVLFAFEPRKVAVLENDVMIDHSGPWPTPVEPMRTPGRVQPGGEPAVAGLPGPVAAPGRWFAENGRLRIAPELVELLDLPDHFRLSVVRDEYQAPGPAAKQGVLLRGDGVPLGGAPGTITVTQEVAVDWDGVDTSTRTLLP